MLKVSAKNPHFLASSISESASATYQQSCVNNLYQKVTRLFNRHQFLLQAAFKWNFSLKQELGVQFNIHTIHPSILGQASSVYYCPHTSNAIKLEHLKAMAKQLRLLNEGLFASIAAGLQLLHDPGNPEQFTPMEGVIPYIDQLPNVIVPPDSLPVPMDYVPY